MENEKKKRRVPIVSIICWILGVCLILVGIIVPQARSQKENYTFSVDDDGFGSYYEFEVEVNESLNTDAAYAKIKIGGVKTQTFKLDFNFGESTYGEYIFTLELSGDDRSMFNEVVELEITNTDGKVLVFKEESVFDDFGDKSSNIILTVIPIFFGVFLIMTGFVWLFVRKHAKHIKRVNDKIINTVFGIEPDEPEVKVVEIEKEPNSITCKYCKVENDPGNAKCEHCGAPLIRNKKNK